MFKLRLSAKACMILFLIILAIWGTVQQDDAKVVMLPLLVSVLTAVLLDLIIHYSHTKRLMIPSSALISGLIIAMAMQPQKNYLYYILASVLAIVSKHLLRIEKRHIFNPAGFGLLITAIIFHTTLSWWGAVNNWFLAIAGIFMVYKIKRWPVVVSYLLAMVILLSIYAKFNQSGISDYFPVINLFFVFVMLIEPMTSLSGRLSGWLFGSIVAIGGFIFYLFLPQYDFALSGLLIGNLANIFLRRLKKK
jgi:Na+-translocating ferredoxin:NAD+ oxidoreductase RnfD subunit